MARWVYGRSGCAVMEGACEKGQGTSEARIEWLCSFLALLLNRYMIYGTLFKPLGVTVSSSVKWE